MFISIVGEIGHGPGITGSTAKSSHKHAIENKTLHKYKKPHLFRVHYNRQIESFKKEHEERPHKEVMHV